MAASSLLGDRSMYQLTLQDIESGGQQYENGSEELYKNEAWLREQYVDNKRTLRDIAEECGCSHVTIGKWMDRHGVETRSSGCDIADERLEDEEWLRQRYIEEENTTYEIAEECGCCHATVSAKLSQYEIEIRGPSGFACGAENPNWGGGAVPYGPGWNESKKRKVRERDGRKCVDCGMAQNAHKDEHGEKLHVHHLRKARNVDDPEERNAMENLVSLCRVCHRRWERIAATGLLPDHTAV